MVATMDNPFKRCTIIINDSSLSQQNLHSTGSQALAGTSSPHPNQELVHFFLEGIAHGFLMAQPNHSAQLEGISKVLPHTLR